MDIFYLLALLLSTLVFIIIPILIIVLIYFLIKKKANKKTALATGVTLFIIFAYCLIADFYPRDSFYTNNFKENTELTLPKSAKLKLKIGNNSIYDFGGYNISYTYQFADSADYDKLYSQLLDKGFKLSNIYLETTENDKILAMLPNLKEAKMLAKDYGFKNFDVLFLNDNKTILFNSNKW